MFHYYPLTKYTHILSLNFQNKRKATELPHNFIKTKKEQLTAALESLKRIGSVM